MEVLYDEIKNEHSNDKDRYDKLKRIARHEGIPHQSLVTSIIHKYIDGSFVDIQEAKKSSISNYDSVSVITGALQEVRSRVKGRDRYDMSRFFKNELPLQLHHLEQRTRQSGPEAESDVLNKDDFLDLYRS